jgi:hypothetical protein
MSCGAEPGSGATAEEAEPLRAAPLAGVVPASPRPVVTTDGKRHLVYELVLQDVGATPVTLTSVEVLGDDDGAPPLVRYEGDGLKKVAFVVNDDGTGALAPGGQGVVFVDAALPAKARVPRRLTNRLVTTDVGATAQRRTSTVAVAVVDERPAVIGAPLRGQHLIDLNGCCAGDHTRALLAFPDGLFLAQRYAIDFVRVDVAGALAGGNPFAIGDPTKNESYLTFGADVLAVTDGRIVDVRDGTPENVPGVEPPADVETAAGNYVIEALDDHRFALYAHVQPGSLRVHPGDRVRRGDVLALVGNTGNSSMPHLHFHVMDRASPLDANGLPYVFDHFELEATVDVNADDPQPVFVPAPQARHDLLPMEGDLVGFR